MTDEFMEISDNAFVSYFTGSIESVGNLSKNTVTNGIDGFFSKIVEEEIVEINSIEVYNIFFRLIDCTNIENWIKKFFLMINMQCKFSMHKTGDLTEYPTNEEIMCYFIGLTRWIPIEVENHNEVRENFLKNIWKYLCWGMEWEDVLDLWYFFDTEEVIQDWEDILIDKIGIRLSIKRIDKPDERLWDFSDESLEMRNFQKEMK